MDRPTSGVFTSNIRLRLATGGDIPALHALIELSVRELQAGDYTAEQIEGALGTVLGLDTTLISDGTYYVLEAEVEGGGAVIAGCGGWSKRRTLFGSDHGPGRQDDWLDPRVDAAKIRAFFIHPSWARRGLGTRMLEACENAAEEAGFLRFELGATLTGVRLFQMRGYTAGERIEVPLQNGASLPVIRMFKPRN
jgi:GNAT superfamily N-acetyltransferase